MDNKIIIAAKKGRTRDILTDYFKKSARVVALNRESILDDQAIVIEDHRVLWNDEDILENAALAIVIDSGYMWQIPNVDPTEEEWNAFHNRYDEFLRNNREGDSLWYSLLEIINEQVSISINPPSAFAMEAMKPYAFAHLSDAGVEIAPFVATNDPSTVAAFSSDNPKTALRRLSMVPGMECEFVDANVLKDLHLDREPVFLQAICHPNFTRVVALGDELIWHQTQNKKPPESLVKSIGKIQTCLGAYWTELEFAISEGDWQLTDFTVSPTLDDIEEEAMMRLLAGLKARI